MVLVKNSMEEKKVCPYPGYDLEGTYYTPRQAIYSKSIFIPFVVNYWFYCGMLNDLLLWYFYKCDILL
jgi:hypothetical protein